VEPFECTFSGTSWFGTDVLYLEPQPDEPFRALTALVANAFPDYPPYEGVHADVVPHLTVGGPGAAASDLQRAETAVLPTLPIRTWVDSVHLMTGSSEPDAWRTVRTLPLATRLG
jgi:2'-5' RNA ligase